MKYPANPNTNLKKEFEELLEKKRKEDEQRKLYREQVLKLQESAQRKRREETENSNAENSKRGWFQWLKFKRNDGSN
jgi:hypothetical protein